VTFLKSNPFQFKETLITLNISQLIKNTDRIWKRIEKNLKCLRAFQRILNDQLSQIWTYHIWELKTLCHRIEKKINQKFVWLKVASINISRSTSDCAPFLVVPFLFDIERPHIFATCHLWKYRHRVYWILCYSLSILKVTFLKSNLFRFKETLISFNIK
jgi:hypothetical protein